MCERLRAWLMASLDEVILGLGLALVTCGLWSQYGRLALVVPGLVLAWIALPTRRAFVDRSDPAPPAARRKQ